MATFLQLVQDLARESGTLAGGVSLPTLTNVTGRADKMAGWVRKAWINIQNERADWPWMKREFTAPLIIGQSRYTAAELGIASRFGKWIGDSPHGRRIWHSFTLFDPATGQEDEGIIREVDYLVWRERYARGTHDADRPQGWAASPQEEFCIGPRPNKAYTLTGEYRVFPQVLTDNTDVPELPEQYHGAIVWEAMKLLGMADEAPQTSGSAVSEYVIARSNLTRDYLPEVTLGASPFA